jgi:hypothetical protein
MLETLRTDFQRIPGLLAQGAPPQPTLDVVPEPEEEPPPEPQLLAAGQAAEAPAAQLGLF